MAFKDTEKLALRTRDLSLLPIIPVLSEMSELRVVGMFAGPGLPGTPGDAGSPAGEGWAQAATSRLLWLDDSGSS